MRKFLPLVAVCAVLSITGCGNTQGERALSGGGIGAGVGAVGSALTGGSPWTGAVVGGVAGAATGALTDKDDINLD
jgi:osmotically inducible lipoprotein OsmB